LMATSATFGGRVKIESVEKPRRLPKFFEII
jgi:hypothetical protein